MGANIGGAGEAGQVCVTCPRGLAGFLAEEIRGLGLPVLEEGETTVATEGGWDAVMRLNLGVRTGHRVLVRVAEADAVSADDLYRAALGVPWEEHLEPRGYFTVRGEVSTPAIRDSRYALLRVKDAVADRFRQRTGGRPDSGGEDRGAALFVYWQGERAVLYLDTSGVPLSRRGYRVRPVAAPLRESLAAAVAAATGWRGGGPLVIPMCGSGTIAIEAACRAAGLAPGLTRSHFAFLHLRGAPREAWAALCAEARAKAGRLVPGTVLATDLRASAVSASKENAFRAGVGEAIRFATCDFAATPRVDGPAVVVLHPGYGRRLGRERDLERLYRRIGPFLRAYAPGGRGYVLCGNPRLAAAVGLEAARGWTFWNGPIRCRLAEYRLPA